MGVETITAVKKKEPTELLVGLGIAGCTDGLMGLIRCLIARPTASYPVMRLVNRVEERFARRGEGRLSGRDGGDGLQHQLRSVGAFLGGFLVCARTFAGVDVFGSGDVFWSFIEILGFLVLVFVFLVFVRFLGR